MSLFIHIGIVKAASTTLQEDVFARHSGLHHIGAPWRSDALSDAFTDLLRCEIYDFDAARLRELVQAQLREASAKRLVAGLSAEAFTICDKANRLMLAQRLREACGPAKIVAVLRNQIDWLSSRYIHNYIKPIPETRLDFDDWLVTTWQRDTFTYRHHADFDTLLRVYEETFGGDNVEVLLFEDLVRDRQKFMSDLCGRVGLDPEEGVRLSQVAHREKRGSRLGYLRRRLRLLPNVPFSRMVPKGLYSLATRASGGSMTPTFSDKWRREIEDFYRPGNQRVATRFGIDLAARGYAV